MDRVILHVDMNAFFASVEMLSHPEAAGCPMAVCGDVNSRRGIILAKNQMAKQCGVQTAEPVWQARRKCPDLLLFPPHHARYREYSERANQLYRRFTDRMEPMSIDESFLDVTGSQNLFGDGAQIADTIRERVKTELGLSVSVGVSFCKIFAKLGSDYKKPDATTVITRENYQRLLYPLPISDMLSIGESTALTLQRRGVHTLGQLADWSESALISLLGKHGQLLYRNVHGLDDDPVRCSCEQEEVKSIGNGMTYKRDLSGLADIRAGILPLAESVGERLRQQGLYCNAIQVSIKDPQFKVMERQQQLAMPTHLTRELYDAALELIQGSWPIGDPIRLITLTAIRLTNGSCVEQLSLFDSPTSRNRLEALDAALDKIRNRYGSEAVKPASSLQSDLGIKNKY